MDEEILQSAKSGLPKNYIIKEWHVFDILGKMAGTLAKREDIIFKGGTALNKIYLGEMQRFSEDIDFDCFYKNKEEKIIELGEILNEIEGYSVSKRWRLRETLRFELSYVLKSGQKDRVFVEFNLRKGKCPFEVLKGTARSDISGQVVAGIPTYSLPVLTMLKIDALISRGEGKDVYDVYYGLVEIEKKSLMSELTKNIEKYQEYSGTKIDYEEMIKRCIKKLESLNWKALQKLTNPYIPYQNRPRDWEGFIRNLILLLDRQMKRVRKPVRL